MKGRKGRVPIDRYLSGTDELRAVSGRTNQQIIPARAWDYSRVIRTALDWICDQYREKRPTDPALQTNFNSYRFAGHSEAVADLIARVARVSAETLEIVAAMRAGR